jgi:hypothetical protein
MGYIHAELMAQYAEDAKQHEKPWELWEHGENGTWANCTWHPGWHTDILYRRKPRTVKISDFEVPEPCKVSLEYGQEYYIPLMTTAGAALREWNGDKHDTYVLKSNLVHLDFQSAEIHAKALIEVSKGWWK